MYTNNSGYEQLKALDAAVELPSQDPQILFGV